MELTDLRPVALELGTSERIKLFGWWLHNFGARPEFQQHEVKRCYETLHMAPPGSFGSYFGRMVDKKELLKNRDGYRLEAKVRADLDARYGESPTTVEITALLRALPAKLPAGTERQYLDEALRCYKAGAPRAAIVMTWNVVYGHLCEHVVQHKLADFNARWQQDYYGDHKKAVRTIKIVTDFPDEELNEFKVLKICLDADIITKNVHSVLESGLKRRNQAAHPNDVSIKQLQVDAYIDELITNGLLKIV